MAVGTNGPPVVSGATYVYPQKTLAQLRKSVVARLGFAAQLSNPPPGVNTLVNDFLQSAHEQIYLRYPQLRQKRWWTIALQQGSRHYDIPKEGAYYAGTDVVFNSASPDTITAGGDFTAAGFTNGMTINIAGSDSNDGLHTATTVATGQLTLSTNLTLTAETSGNQVFIRGPGAVELDPTQIEYVGMLDGTLWNDMISGIKPTLFNITGQQRPTHYQVREFIEVFPEPDQAYTLYLFGKVARGAFSADTDYTTTDPHPVFLQALGEAKAHYGQPDANIYFQRLEAMLGELNAGTFSNDRFIPNPEIDVPNLPKPKVTFPRT